MKQREPHTALFYSSAALIDEAIELARGLSQLGWAIVFGGVASTRKPEGLCVGDENRYPCLDYDLVFVGGIYPPKISALDSDNLKLKAVVGQIDPGWLKALNSIRPGHRIVVCRPEDCGRVLEWIRAGHPNEEKFQASLVGAVLQAIGSTCESIGINCSALASTLP